VQNGSLERADALLRAAHPDELELLLNAPRPLEGIRDKPVGSM
jgi:hypothetical protein